MDIQLAGILSTNKDQPNAEPGLVPVTSTRMYHNGQCMLNIRYFIDIILLSSTVMVLQARSSNVLVNECHIVQREDSFSSVGYDVLSMVPSRLLCVCVTRPFPLAIA